MRRPLRLILVSLLLSAVCLVGCTPPPAADPPPAAAVAHTHDAAGETCFVCDPAKRDKGRLWCAEHGRYEDRCWDCHPELQDHDRLYCEEHGLYEDECFLCDPARGGHGEGGGADAGEIDGGHEEGGHGDGLFCDEHRVPEVRCGICQPQLAAGLPPGDSLLIRLASERSAELAGLAIGQAVRADGSSTVPLLGEIRYDGNRLARVTARAYGVVARVDVDLGQVVKAGDTLALVNAPAVAEATARAIAAQADLDLADVALRRQEALFRDQISSQRALDEARGDQVRASVAVTAALQGLLGLGFREADTQGISGATSTMPLRAPFAGTVVQRAAVLGEAVQGDDVLFEIADLRQMWVELSMPEAVAAAVGAGTPIRVAVRTRASDPLDGTITWVGPVVDERTRMVQARGIVPNSDGALRQGMFADVTAVLESVPDSLRLPSSAVHRVDDLPFVFVREEADLFQARRVDLGDRLPTNEFVIRAGVALADEVVLVGGFALKSALLASRLGAGCADD